MRNRIHGIFEHFTHIKHRIRQRLVIRQFVNIRQQTLHRSQLQILSKILRGLIWCGRQHQRLRTQPTRRNTLARHTQNIKRTAPQHGGTSFGSGTSLMQQIGLLHKLALISSVFRLLLHHLPCGSLGLLRKLALQLHQRFARAKHLDRAPRMTPAMLTLATRRQLLLHRERHAQIRHELAPQFTSQHFRVNLRANNADCRLRERMRQIRPRGHTLRIGRSKIRLLLVTGTRQIRIPLINPRTNLTSRIRSGNKLHAQRLRQRLDHADNQLIQQSGNIPRELFRCQTRQHLQRHMHGHAIVWIMRVIHITQPQIDRGAVRTQRMPMIRIISQRHRLGISKTLHLLRIKIQQIWLLIML